jgi:hypothetical protein
MSADPIPHPRTYRSVRVVSSPVRRRPERLVILRIDSRSRRVGGRASLSPDSIGTGIPAPAGAGAQGLADLLNWWHSLRRWERLAVAYVIVSGLCLLAWAWAWPALLLPELPGVKP